MTDFMVGDRVSIEGTVELVGSAKARVHLAGGDFVMVLHDDLRLLDRPAPPLPSCECGHGWGAHTATGPVSNCRVGSDSPRLADECTCLIYRPATPEPSQTDLCECGHERRRHYSGGCMWGSCMCPRGPYRPATPSTEETR